MNVNFVQGHVGIQVTQAAGTEVEVYSLRDRRYTFIVLIPVNV